ncbi:hypothetical protein Tco_1324080, partial [Tanacetum coccineum]
MVLMGWKLRKRKWTDTTERLIEDLESTYGRMNVDGHVDIFDTIDIDLFSVVALNMMVVQLGYTATTSHFIEDVMRQLSFKETELDGEAGFGDVVGTGIDSSGLSHDESFRVDDLDLNISQTETQAEFPVFEEDESAPSYGRFFYDIEGIDSVYETQYDVHSNEDAGTDDDDEDDDFLVDEENSIVEHDIDVHLFGEDVDFINPDGFNSDPSNDNETSNYRRRRLAKLSREMEGFMNASGQWKYSFYTGRKYTTAKEAKGRVYLHSIESRRILKLYKNDNVRVRERCEGKVPIFTMSQGTRPTVPNQGMEAGPSRSSGPKTIFDQVRVNPEIPVKAVQDQLQHDLELQVFQRIYVCLGALKLGFRACGRELLSLDGAFMKRPFPSQVLTAVRLDSNNRVYPLAYALVEFE